MSIIYIIILIDSLIDPDRGTNRFEKNDIGKSRLVDMLFLISCTTSKIHRFLGNFYKNTHEPD